jgi:hypothetical protein
MNYLSVSQMAKKWNMSERGVRKYCAEDKIPGAFLTGKTWNIPENAEKPKRKNKKSNEPQTLLERLKSEKASHISGAIYHKIQIEFTYNSNHIEGSKLTHDQTRYIFETNTIGVENDALNVDDIIETANHFKCIDMIIDNAKYKLTEKFIKQLHYTLKSGTSDSRKDWFNVGEYKKLPNEVGGMRHKMSVRLYLRNNHKIIRNTVVIPVYCPAVKIRIFCIQLSGNLFNHLNFPDRTLVFVNSPFHCQITYQSVAVRLREHRFDHMLSAGNIPQILLKRSSSEFVVDSVKFADKALPICSRCICYCTVIRFIEPCSVITLHVTFKPYQNNHICKFSDCTCRTYRDCCKGVAHTPSSYHCTYYRLNELFPNRLLFYYFH